VSLACQDCKTALSWKGRGRKPKRCAPCGKKANRAKVSHAYQRDSLHKQGKSVSRWGSLWLVNGKAVRREARYVWRTSHDEDTVTSTSGVFHAIGKDGLPDEGFTTSNKDIQARLAGRWSAPKVDAEAANWLATHPDWWRIEPWAHGTLSHSVTDSIVIHAPHTEDVRDEHAPGERCTWCGEHRSLDLAGEFCSAGCMTDYVATFGAWGLELKGGFDVGGHPRGMATGSGYPNDALVR
jgi:hypothetical protein